MLFKLLGSECKQLMVAAEECIRKFLEGTETEGSPIETDVIHNAMRPTLLKMGDYRLERETLRDFSKFEYLYLQEFNSDRCSSLGGAFSSFSKHF